MQMKKITTFVMALSAALLLTITYLYANKNTESLNITQMKNTKEIYFAGGCFWGTEHFFKQIRGVVSTQVGYANGNIQNPTYEQVYTDLTGFTETVKVVYQPEEVSLELLLELFFKTIDPTSLNKQGNDKGTRYRTGIYFTDKADEKIIKQALNDLAKQYTKSVVVETCRLKIFMMPKVTTKITWIRTPEAIVISILNYLNWQRTPIRYQRRKHTKRLTLPSLKKR